MAGYGTFDLGSVLQNVDAIKTAQQRSTLFQNQIAEQERVARERDQLREARTQAWGGDTSQLVGLAPNEALQIRSYFDGLSEDRRRRELETAERNVDHLGQIAAWVTAQPDPAAAWAEAYKNLPESMRSQMPEEYRPGFVAVALARATSTADLLDEIKANRGREAFNAGIDANTARPGRSAGVEMVPAAHIRQELVQRGLPEHVAEGFVLNMQDESGLRPGINEAKPLVPGSRGGFGLYQLTGPRRVAYEQWASARGVPLDDPSAQLDFLAHELQTSERAAADKIMATRTPGEAAAAIATFFLRPSEKHLAARVAKYTAGEREQQGMDQRQADLMKLAGDPDLSAEQRAMVASLIESFKPVGPQSPEGKVEADRRAGLLPDDPQPEFRIATPEEAARYGAQAGQFGPDGRFYPINPPSGMTIESDGQGGFRLEQGPGASSGKPLNEGQSKNVIYATRAEGALPLIDQYGEALTSRLDAAAEGVPLGLARGAQSPEFQQARQAGDEFLQAILRKDTGAAITSQEMIEYGRTYLPMPGDGPEVLEQKRQSRARAVEALRRGMTPTEILALERPMGDAGGSPALPSDPQVEPLDSILDRYR